MLLRNALRMKNLFGAIKAVNKVPLSSISNLSTATLAHKTPSIYSAQLHYFTPKRNFACWGGPNEWNPVIRDVAERRHLEESLCEGRSLLSTLREKLDDDARLKINKYKEKLIDHEFYPLAHIREHVDKYPDANELINLVNLFGNILKDGEISKHREAMKSHLADHYVHRINEFKQHTAYLQDLIKYKYKEVEEYKSLQGQIETSQADLSKKLEAFKKINTESPDFLDAMKEGNSFRKR